jgi:hypothetical protein
VSFIIDQSIEVEAPVEIVWEVITDLPRYGEWNPFVIECRSGLEVGDPIVMRVQIFEAFAQPQTEVVKVHSPGQHLCYGLLKPLSATHTLYHSSFELRGWLNPVVQTLLGGRLEAGFGAMTDALAARAEALRAERESA